MLESQRIELRRSAIRERLAEISKLAEAEYTAAIREEEGKLQGEYASTEIRLRSAVIAEDAAEKKTDADADPVDPEKREKAELRAKVRVGRYIEAALRGRAVTGAESEFSEACGVDGIPFDLWQPEPEKRAVAAGPTSGTGVNVLAPIAPAVFASAVAPRLGIEMPSTPSGTFSSMRISTSQSASALAAGGAAAGVAGKMDATTVAPHRVAARLELSLESIAAVGAEDFESALRENLSMALSNQLDQYVLSGDGTGANPAGLLKALTDPTATTNVADFDSFLASVVGAIDGIWASDLRDVFVLTGIETFRLSAQAWRDKLYGSANVSATNARAATTNAQTFAAWAVENLAGWVTSAKIPAPSSDNQPAVVYRRGRPGMRTAVMPTWGSIAVDDIYSGAAKGERYLTLSTLVGDCIIVQPGAYAELSYHLK